MPNYVPGGYSDSDSDDDDLFVMSNTSSKKGRGRGDNNAVYVVPELPPTVKARNAIASRDIETIRQLLQDRKITVDAEIDYYKWSMLMFAAKDLNAELMQYLIQQGANPNFRGTDGNTPLFALASTEEKKNDEKRSMCLSILLEAGADITLKDKIEATVLHMAAKTNNEYLAKRFLELGVPIDALDLSGRTALHHVAEYGYGRLNRLLILEGGSVGIIDDEGLKPSEIASNRGHNTVADILYKVESTEWMPGRDPELVKVFREIKPRDQLEAFVVTQRDQIEMILGQIELPHLLPLFEQHDINYFTFLRLHDDYLREMGISDPAERLKVMDSTRAANTHNWEKSCVASVFTEQAGITMPEVICIVGNLKKHMRFMSKTLNCVHASIRENPNVLCIGSESASIKDLCREMDLSMKGLEQFANETQNTRELVVQLGGYTDVNSIGDVPVPASKQGESKKNVYLLFGLGCIIGALFITDKHRSSILAYVKPGSVQ